MQDISIYVCFDGRAFEIRGHALCLCGCVMVNVGVSAEMGTERKRGKEDWSQSEPCPCAETLAATPSDADRGPAGTGVNLWRMRSGRWGSAGKRGWRAGVHVWRG